MQMLAAAAAAVLALDIACASACPERWLVVAASCYTWAHMLFANGV